MQSFDPLNHFFSLLRSLLSLSSREEKERCGKGTRARLLLFLLRPYIPPLLPLLLATVQPPLACKTLSSRGPKVKF